MPNPALTELLASYVPRLIQNRVAADPSPIEVPVSEEMQAAVLFADISGFTLLTEHLAERGPAGVETLARILNEYFGQLIDIIHDYGGDVVKFAGDAVIAVWPIVANDVAAGGTGEGGAISRADLWQWTMRAAECAITVRERLSNYKVEDASLYLKLAVSTGHITAAHVGGVFSRWEFLLTGNPLVELGIANSLAGAGDILITPSAWKLIRNDAVASPLEFELKDAYRPGRPPGKTEQAVLHFHDQKESRDPRGRRKLAPGLYSRRDHQPSLCRAEQLDRRAAARFRPVHQPARHRPGYETGVCPEYCAPDPAIHLSL